MNPKTDLELVEDFRRGDITAYNELVRRYQQKVYWIGRRILGTHEDADDVVQEVFIRVYENLKNFRAESGFYTWLYRIAMNLSLNTLQKKRIKDFVKYDSIIDTLEGENSRTDEPALHREYETLLEKAVESLPAKQRAVFMMRYYDEMSYEEMAKVLKKSVGGLKANYFHALKKVQKILRDKYHEL
jgi:RNA polymerase sigma-70 factor (ECF subfamily)